MAVDLARRDEIAILVDYVGGRTLVEPALPVQPPAGVLDELPVGPVAAILCCPGVQSLHIALHATQELLGARLLASGRVGLAGCAWVDLLGIFGPPGLEGGVIL